MKNTDENYEKLAEAIIVRAIIDYRKSKDEEVKKSIERFFRSEWFYVLTNLDGEMLIKRLKREEGKKWVK